MEQKSVSERPTIHESLRGSTCVQQYTLLLPHTPFRQQENYARASTLKPSTLLFCGRPSPSYVFLRTKSQHSCAARQKSLGAE